MEKEVEKIIKLSFPMYANDSWDRIVYDPISNDGLHGDYIELIKHLVIKEKDKILYTAASRAYLRKKVFFDINYNFNDTLNKLKAATIDLLNIFNETK